ncbi:MAG: integrase [Actinomycetota bacterium]
MAHRKAVTKEMARRYARSSKGEKGRILDQLVVLTGWTRRHARRALALAANPPPPAGRPRGRPPIYGPAVVKALTKVWATLDGLSGKRLAPFLPEIVPVMERFGELELEPEVRAKLLRVSAATIDRLLAPERKRLRLKGRQGTKAGTLLRAQVPIRTFSDWDDLRPGFFEADLVAHDGGDSRGVFCQTLTLTDVASGWTEIRALKNKAQRWVFESLRSLQKELPIPMLGLDSDNGGEFINLPLVTWCRDQAITFTRSRPYRKNDNCFVEQKNGAVVRQALGYLRYDSDRELRALTRLYRHLRLYVNFFQPQMRLLEKTREGAKVRRRHDRAQTPCQRLLASSEVSIEAKEALRATYLRLNPVALKREIARIQDLLVKHAKLKETIRRKEVRTSPDHPWRTPILRQRAQPSRTS